MTLREQAEALELDEDEGQTSAPSTLEVVDLRSAAGTGVQARLASPSLSLGRYTAWLVVADATVGLLSAVVGIVSRFSGATGRINGFSYLLLVPIFLLGWVGVMWAAGTYDRSILVSGPEEFRRVLNGAVWMLAGIAIAGFVTHVAVSRAVIAIALVSATLLSLATRYSARRAIHRRLRGERTLHRAVVVGTEEQAEGLAAHMRRNAHVGFAVTAVHQEGHQAKTMSERIAAILADVEKSGADTVAVAGTGGFTSSQLRQLAWGLEGTGVRLLLVPALTDLAGPRIRVRPVDGLPLLHIEEPDFSGPKQAAKHLIDVVGGTLLLIVASPVLAAIALAVWIGSGRPILYSQIRVGRHGEEFRMFKFRTMVPGADSQAEEDLDDASGCTPVRPKPAWDPRVTPVGRFLRRHSLDELPQLFNVFIGQMSLVGPRPHRPFEVADYQDHDHRRLLIKPGVTGLWQVSGRAELPWNEAVRLDLYYVENWSVWLDVLLILKTIRAVLLPRGAY